MSYIDLINQFWRTRRSKRITGNQADVYYCLMQECNERNWENPFEFPNMSICARIGITEPTLIDARARLKQLGLIEFEAGERKVKSPVYTLLYLNDFSITFSKNRAKTEYKPSIKVNLLNKTKKKTIEVDENLSELHSDHTQKTKVVDILIREENFYKEVAQYTQAYKKETLRKFYDYWSETTHTGKKLRFEIEKTWELSKRLKTWERNEDKFERSNRKTDETLKLPVKTPTFGINHKGEKISL